jgi:hypothetical protein
MKLHWVLKLSKATIEPTPIVSTNVIVLSLEGCNRDIDIVMNLNATPLPLIPLHEDSSKEGNTKHEMNFTNQERNPTPMAPLNVVR